MIPIQKFLNKILWDDSLDPADFEIGIYDRVDDKLFYKLFLDIEIDKDDKFSFTSIDDDGSEHTVPFHRIKVILEKVKVVWERPKK